MRPAPQCGYAFPPPERQPHEAQAGTAAVLSGQVSLETYPVQAVMYSIHTKRDAPADHPRSMRVDYRLGLGRWQAEWICLEHTGYARRKAELWWRRRSNVPVPDSAEDAVHLAEHGALAQTRGITIRSVSDEKYDRIVGYDLAEVPAYREPGWDDEEIEPGGKPEPCAVGDSDEEVPF